MVSLQTVDTTVFHEKDTINTIFPELYLYIYRKFKTHILFLLFPVYILFMVSMVFMVSMYLKPFIIATLKRYHLDTIEF